MTRWAQRSSGSAETCASATTRPWRRRPPRGHLHKYDRHPLDHEHSFHFRCNPEEATGHLAANLPQLETELIRC